jgi:16S rRNA (cytosine1402-N4)-methyltransferase
MTTNRRPAYKRFKKSFKPIKKASRPRLAPSQSTENSSGSCEAEKVSPLVSPLHLPVMCEQVLEQMRQVVDETPVFLDATFGRGGHTQALLEALPHSRVVALDCDPDAISFGEKEVVPLYPHRLQLIHSCFSDIESYRSALPAAGFSGILMDLGVSSPQLDQAERGFSFSKEGPLDMRMQKQGITAAEVINTFSEEKIAHILFEYGQERLSRRIARNIIKKRSEKLFATTHDLANLICNIMPPSKIHPATRTFQALRIFVNGELEKLEKTLDFIPTLLKPGARVVVISFHSLEDRIVKLRFRHQNRALCLFSEISKKIITPSEEELKHNPRSRSACMRFALFHPHDPQSRDKQKFKKYPSPISPEGEMH